VFVADKTGLAPKTTDTTDKYRNILPILFKVIVFNIIVAMEESIQNQIEVSGNSLSLGGKTYHCAIGKSGIIAEKDKREGDGATPAGLYMLRKVMYRKDKIGEIETGLPKEVLEENDGWCDDMDLPQYNQQIKLPFAGSYENLWREDDVYDVIIPIGYNDSPVYHGYGSAIFMHIAREGYSPTAGCVAVSLPDMLEILPQLNPETTIKINL